MRERVLQGLFSRPQPDEDHLAVIDVSAWTLESQRYPALVDASKIGGGVFACSVGSKIRRAHVRDLCGQDWTPDACVWLGCSSTPLVAEEEQESWRGMLITVLSGGQDLPLLEPMGTLLQHPQDWARDVTSHGLPEVQISTCTMGVTGWGVHDHLMDWPLSADWTSVCNAVGRICNQPRNRIRVCSSSTNIPRLDIRGRWVPALYGVMPDDDPDDCGVFIDLRQLDYGVVFVWLPHRRMNIEELLAAVDVPYPFGWNLHLEGASLPVGLDDCFFPSHRDVLVVSMRDRALVYGGGDSPRPGPRDREEDEWRRDDGDGDDADDAPRRGHRDDPPGRSRSPRRGANSLGQGLLHSVRDEQAHSFCPQSYGQDGGNKWKPVSREYAVGDCMLVDTPVPPLPCYEETSDAFTTCENSWRRDLDDVLDSGTVLGDSSAEARRLLLDKVGSRLIDVHDVHQHGVPPIHRRDISLSHLLGEFSSEKVRPQHFDMDCSQCQLPLDDALFYDLHRYVPFHMLQAPPHPLFRPERFDSWVKEACIGRFPGPDEDLVFTSDGTFVPQGQAMGWGITIAARKHGVSEAGQLIGCAWGSLQPLIDIFGQSILAMGAYAAEVAGLMWTAILIIQLRWKRRTVIQCDCQSALDGAAGRADFKPHPIGRATRALHLCLFCILQTNLSYHYIPGHQGLQPNELADALARFAVKGPAQVSSFSLDLARWFRQDGAAFTWLPHLMWSQSNPGRGPELQDGFMVWQHTPQRLGCEPGKIMQPFLRGTEVHSYEDTASSSVQARVKLLTFNALSLRDGANQRGAADGLHGEQGRVKLLETCLRSAEIHVAGIQEARTPKGTATCGDFVRFSGGSDDSHNFGLELWVNVRQPIANSNGELVRLRHESCTIIHAEPTILLARLTCKLFDWNVAVLHGPHRAHTELTIKGWWHRVTRMCGTCQNASKWIFLMDANARVGSVCSDSIGDFEFDEEDIGGESLHCLLQSLQLFMPCTFLEYVWGSSQTLVQKRNLEWSRSDYIAIPAEFKNSSISAWTDHSVSAGHGIVDHVALMTQIDFRCQIGKRRAEPHCTKIDPEALCDPKNHEAIRDILWSMPSHDWETSVHEQAADMVDHMYVQLSSAFPVPRKRMRNACFSERTGSLHASLCSARRQARMRRWALRCTYLRCALEVWKSPNDGISFVEVLSGKWLATLRANLAVDSHRIATFGKLLKQSCRDDRNGYVENIVQEIEAANMQDLYGALHKLAKPKRFRRQGMAPLPQLKKLDGELCQSTLELTQRWREHFAALEGGVEVDPDGLARRCVLDQEANAGSILTDFTEFPSFEDLALAFRAVQPKKASGPDLIPPDICRRFSYDLSVIFWPVLLKSVCVNCEPAGFKGGALHRLPKPTGDRTQCSSQRGILLQPALAKVVQRASRRLISSAFESDALDFQIGGRKQFTAIFGSMATRSLLRFARKYGHSCSVTYVDLAAAYYAIVRELVFGCSVNGGDIDAITKSLHMDPDDLQFLTHLARSEPVLSSQPGKAMLTRLARELHRHTWFVMKGDCQLVETFRGTRPGGSWADAVFNLLFAKAVRRKREAAERDHAPRISWDGHKSLQPLAVGNVGSCTSVLGEIIFADDLAACSMTPSPAHIVDATISTARELLTTFAQHGLKANFGRTKTAVTMSINGTGCRKARHHIFSQLGGRLPILLEASSTWLDVVPQYRHLGSVVTHSGILRPEILTRLNLARAAMKQSKRHVFGNRAIGIQKRVVLFRSSVLSSLLHGSGSWPYMHEGDYRMFEGGIFSLFRQVIAIPAKEDQKWTRKRILDSVCIPQPQTLIHMERLRFLVLLVNRGPDSLWALLRHDDAYLRAVRIALDWLYHRLRGTIDLPCPHTGWEQWKVVIGQKPGVWKGWIRRAACIEVYFQQMQHRMEALLRALWHPAPECHGQVPGHFEHACIPCGLAFASRQQWGSHACRCHQYKAAHTTLAKGRRCQACGTMFAAERRLRNHLRDSDVCRHAYSIGRIDAQVVMGDGHPQAPPGSGVKPVFDDLPAEVHADLLQRLQRDDPVCGAQLWDVVKTAVGPLPTLRNTLVKWRSHANPQQCDLADELLSRFRPADLCLRAHKGSMSGRSPDMFEPLLTPFPTSCAHDRYGVFCIGTPSFAWLEAHSLLLRPRTTHCFWNLAEDTEIVSALWVQVPPPPLRCKAVDEPESSSLKMLRKFLFWHAQLMRVLRLFCTAAQQGFPAHCCFQGLELKQLGLYGEWCVACGVESFLEARASFSFT